MDNYPEPTNQNIAQNYQLSDDKKHKARLLLKLMGVAILGCIAGIFLYFPLIDGPSNTLEDRVIMQGSFYRPNAVLNKSSVVAWLIIVTVLYWLSLRFIFRSQRSFKQALSAVLISQLLIIGSAALAFTNNNIAHFLDPSLWFSILVSTVVFCVCNYLAEKPWSWKISRLPITLLVIATVVALDFSCSAYASHRHAQTQKQEKKQQAAADAKIKTETSTGSNTSLGYALFYLNPSLLQRYKVTGIVVNTTDDFDAQAGVPPFSEITLTDTTQSNLSLHLYILKANKKVFDPPAYCGNADPRTSIPLDYHNYQQSAVLNYKCYGIGAVNGLGALYGAIPGSTTNEYPENQDLAQGLYYDYYVQQGNNLITLDDSPAADLSGHTYRLTASEVVTLFSSLQPISPADLQKDSQQLIQH